MALLHSVWCRATLLQLPAHRIIELGDVGATAADLLALVAPRTGYRTDAVREAVAERDDRGHGAEVLHFPDADHTTVTFPETDLAAVGHGYGFEAVTVRAAADLAGVADWVAGPRRAPLLVHAPIASDGGSWWLAEAFRGHRGVPRQEDVRRGLAATHRPRGAGNSPPRNS